MDLVADSDAEKWHQPKHMRSEIWNHFQLNEGHKKAKCNWCKSVFKYSKTTSTLWNHLKVEHKEVEPSKDADASQD